MKENKINKRWLSLSILTMIFVGGGIAWWLLWLLLWRFEISTDDAYVQGNIIPITAEVMAPVTSILVQESDFVYEGDLLIQLNPMEAIAHLESAKSGLAQAVRNYMQLKERVNQTRDALYVKQIELAQANFSLIHHDNLADSGILSGVEIEAARANFEMAERGLMIAESQYLQALTDVEGSTVTSHPLVKNASAQLISAYLNLQHTKIRSPVTGYIGIRAVQPGELVTPGKFLMNVIPLSDIWVAANYKESSLKHIGIGQKVELYSDFYGKSVPYRGSVRGIAPGTGAVFSFLPAQNATGNWIKVVQRVPVLIELDPDQLEKHPLLLGLSMHSTVHVHKDAQLLPLTPLPISHLSTSIYQGDQISAEALVNQVIQENFFLPNTLLSLLIDAKQSKLPFLTSGGF